MWPLKKNVLDYFQAVNGEMQTAEPCAQNGPICVTKEYKCCLVEHLWKDSHAQKIENGVTKSERKKFYFLFYILSLYLYF